VQGVLAGFVTLEAIIALGFLLAHLGVPRADSQLLLSRLVFFVATPALLFQTLATAPVDKILTSGLALFRLLSQPLRNPITVGSFLACSARWPVGRCPPQSPPRSG